MNELDATMRRALRVPAFDGETELEWASIIRDANRRAGDRRRRTTRFGLLAAAAVVAALLAVPAFGLRDHLLDIVQGDPAPPPVKREVALAAEVKGELIPMARRDPGILVEQTRAVRVLRTSTGRLVYLWVAPREDGGYCDFHQIVGMDLPDGRPNLAGGCVPGPRPDRVNAALRKTFVGDGYLSYVSGYAPPGVASLEARFEDGQTMPLRVSEGFFLEEIPDDRELVAVVGHDRGGAVVSRQRFDRLPRARPPADLTTGPERTVIEIETSKGKPASLSVAGPCRRVRFAGTVSGTCGGALPERAIAVGPMQIGPAPGGTLFLTGSVGANVASLELVFQDGTSERLNLVERLVLYEVPPDRFEDGRRPVRLVARDDAGRELAARSLGPYARG